ncbi:uncharacterized protein LOC109539767 [Dendroctonus ponderosae]|uniref:uncharacterized protein LOC109539767 n=1 Tax=Dendroctonus ponderosae TaxID=77166 RepID=UPI002035B368|nr:uncharacterized protein LOC109539767 [Dendroctonus ponderosae]
MASVDSSQPFISSPSEATSINQDPLEWNQKKRTMIINLGLTDHSETGETPTPTRFIRNCEEVGLFQDLQHVNPFDEQFKKAIENSASVTLQVPAHPSDGSLHTPQICPHLQTNPENHHDFHSVESTSLTSLIISHSSPRDDEADDGFDDDDDGNSLVIVEAESSNDHEQCRPCDEKAPALNGTKIRLTQAPKRGRQRCLKKPTRIKLVPIEKLLNSSQGDEVRPEKNIAKVTGEPQSETGKETANATVEVQRQREANKAAQIRCRKRKQQDFEEMKLENARLKTENANLEKQIQKLQQIIRERRLTMDSTSSPTEAMQENSTLDNRILEKPAQNSLPLTKRPSESKKRRRFKSSAVNVRKSLAPIVPKLVLPLPVPGNNPVSSAVQNLPNSALQNSLNTIVVVYPRAVQPVSSAIHHILPK